MTGNLNYTPSYMHLSESGELILRETALLQRLEFCDLCPNECRANRLKGELGQCNAGGSVLISGATPHFGEEYPLVGSRGSGTIFFSHCSLHCIYCQNYEISQLATGYKIDEIQLGNLMLTLQERGCHNINLVTPTHYVPNIIKALRLAISNGLRIPIVYNSSGYESLGTLKELNGIIDIYMPDFKYWDEETAFQYSGIHGYPEKTKSAIAEMYKQVGDLKCGHDGVATRGLIIRHLVLPHDIANSREILHFIAEDISVNTYVNIMAQYRPAYKAHTQPFLDRKIDTAGYTSIINYARSIGLYRGFDDDK